MQRRTVAERQRPPPAGNAPIPNAFDQQIGPGWRNAVMWFTPEDAVRYEELSRSLTATLAAVETRGQATVEPEDLATYLEWLELAIEAAPCIRPFIDKSSPFALPSLSYEQMGQDFAWLYSQVTVAGEMPHWDAETFR
jgi:hypothetical protein